ncbi:hypothetical protein ILUMI_09770 [Ignelater luminosus]|uniref:Uncharacterized protein n=1 Tax=Ignelater luminosus TaxID=2038154 RepID=A0A8K0D1Q7_IGNLU|nr:hypothetical protein ILUMI_09770 [Ignelater luminosus]
MTSTIQQWKMSYRKRLWLTRGQCQKIGVATPNWVDSVVFYGNELGVVLRECLCRADFYCISFLTSAKDKELTVNESKAKLMRIEKTTGTTQNRKIKITMQESEYSFEEVTRFNYLGVEIIDSAEEKNETQETINKGTKKEGLQDNNKTNSHLWRKVLRKIYGGKEIGGLCRRRPDEEPMELWGEPSIANTVRAQRIS